MNKESQWITVQCTVLFLNHIHITLYNTKGYKVILLNTTLLEHDDLAVS